MQVPESLQIVPIDEGRPTRERDSEAQPVEEQEEEDPPVHDVSNNTWELSVPVGGSEESIREFYMYKNVFNLIPTSIGGFERLKTLKFFANEIHLFPSDTENLVELECLQVKVSSPILSGLPLLKLKALKELELSKVPRRPSAFPLLSDIGGLTCLTKLAVCHFSIRFLPPEIACLKKLEDLDLSFNKLKSLPNEITALSDLKSLKVANNKLVELPLGLPSLQKLETLDLSNNRLTSLGPLTLESMQTLRKVNLQYNKLLSCCQIPPWICCDLEGNGKDTSNDEFISSAVAADANVVEATTQKSDASYSCKGSHGMSSSLSANSSSHSRCSGARRIGKGWKRRDYLQQRARQERLNSVRKWRSEDYHHMKVDENCVECKLPALTSESLSESSSVTDCESSCEKDLDDPNDHSLAVKHNQILINHVEDGKSIYDSIDSTRQRDDGLDGDENKSQSISSLGRIEELEGNSDVDVSKSTSKAKRHYDEDLENPKPSKSQKPFGDHSNVSYKYSTESFCGIGDRLPDGFYDAGRDRPFMPLPKYEKNLCLDSREVILLDREMDDQLDVITSSAKTLLSPLKQASSSAKQGDQLADDYLQRAMLLSLFVSNWFGGSDRSNTTARKRKAWSGSNYEKPFVCTCPTGNNVNRTSCNHVFSTAENLNFIELCEKSLHTIKKSRNSNIVPIGTLRWGVCRHRAVLMKYLCDRMVPPIPCELVRGYLDFSPHAWNIIVVRRDESFVRMVVDACCPTDIREETDPEYFCRYIPASRILVSKMTEDIESASCSFPSMSSCPEVENAPSSSLKRCKFGSVEAAAKVRTLKTNEASAEEMKNFEFTFLGEVRLLGALKRHSCIVEIYGHQISSKWVRSVDGHTEHRLLQSAIVMEYIEGGSLKSYLKKLAKGGKKRVPVDLALYIARDIAFALAELHSKHIIHRDIKSENVLIDLDRKKADGSPVVKLCDFDRAVPLRSISHTCCIAHLGVPPPYACVGTPRWMAPEVLRALNIPKDYGLEIDIWSYGCLLLELLTLEIPYEGLPEPEIHDLLQMGQRPRLTDELELLVLSDEPAIAKPPTELVGVETEAEILRFLVDLFHQCTRGNPNDRPTARNLYDMLHVRASSFSSLTS